MRTRPEDVPPELIVDFDVYDDGLVEIGTRFHHGPIRGIRELHLLHARTSG